MAILNEGTTIGGKTILDIVYPVGAIFQTIDKDFLPESEFGGTWERIKGKVLVGVDEEDEDFESSELIGGEKLHTLTSSELPSHNHSFKEGSHSILWGIKSATVYFSSTQATSGSPPSNNPCVKQATWSLTNNSGGVLLTTIFNLIIQFICGEEFHRFNPSFEHKSIIFKGGNKDWLI